MSYRFANVKGYRLGAGCSDEICIPNGSGVPLEGDLVFHCGNFIILPGFVDVHVHLREPGFCYKETIRTGTLAGARGGYRALCAMPNLNPPPDSFENLQVELEAIARDACIPVYPYGTITRGEEGKELSDMAALASYVIAFSDDGRGVQSDDRMRIAMREAKRLNKCIVAHCEDNTLLRGGYIHDGEYARLHGHKGICSESEWGQIARDLSLAKETGCSYHVCHISTKESVELIRKAKAEGLDVSCETAPHYLLLNDSMLQEDGRFKMNPPIRSEADRTALIAGLQDGTIDLIATDHAPHSAEEKSRGLEHSVMGIVGLETAFALLYTNLVRPGVLTLERLLELMVDRPAARFSIPPAEPNTFSVFEMEHPYLIDPGEFQSKGRSTPFEGWQVTGRCCMTVVGGTVVWDDGRVPRTADPV